jgi:hypothetical protein
MALRRRDGSARRVRAHAGDAPALRRGDRRRTSAQVSPGTPGTRHGCQGWCAMTPVPTLTRHLGPPRNGSLGAWRTFAAIATVWSAAGDFGKSPLPGGSWTHNAATSHRRRPTGSEPTARVVAAPQGGHRATSRPYRRVCRGTSVVPEPLVARRRGHHPVRAGRGSRARASPRRGGPSGRARTHPAPPAAPGVVHPGAHRRRARGRARPRWTGLLPLPRLRHGTPPSVDAATDRRPVVRPRS